MTDIDVPLRERVKVFLLQHPQIGRAGFAMVERLKTVRKARINTFTMDAVLAHLSKQGFAPSACLDLGANRGEWSRQARAAFPDAALFLLEPQAEMAATLDAYCKRTDRATWKLVGAGAKPGMMELSVWPGLVGSTFFDAPEISQEYERRSVQIVTLNGLVEEGWMPFPDLVKN